MNNTIIIIWYLIYYRKYRPVDSTEMCASAFMGIFGLGGKGDAGSPLILHKNNTNILIGLASIKSKLLSLSPTIFTRASFYKKWIDECTNNISSVNNQTTNETVPRTNEPTKPITLTAPPKAPGQSTITEEKETTTTTKAEITANAATTEKYDSIDTTVLAAAEDEDAATAEAATDIDT